MTERQERLSEAIRAEFEKWNQDEPITAEEINNGTCADFATLVWERLDRADWIEFTDNEVEIGESYLHTWLKVDGRHFDVACPDGVENWRDLPFFARQKEEVTITN